MAFHKKPPTELGEKDVRAFLTWLVTEKRMSANGMRKFIGGIKYLYKVTLDRPEVVARMPWPRHPKHLPPVPSAEQVAALLGATDDNPRLRALLMLGYGAGLRISEACRIRVDDIDSTRGLLNVRGGKGDKDRVTVLPPRLLAALRDWWRVGRPAGPWVFPGVKGDRPLTIAGVRGPLLKARQ